jgi:hypothetical protein
LEHDLLNGTVSAFSCPQCDYQLKVDHTLREIKPKTLQSILKQANITVEELLENL